MGRLEALYVWYGWTIAALLLLCGDAVPYRWWWLVAHALVVVPAWLLSRVQGGVVRYVAACLVPPVAFSTLGLILPDLSPEPFHWRVLGWDTAIGGLGVARTLAAPPAWLVEICQICYATFYFLPLGLGLVLAAERKWHAFRHGAELIVGGFLLSYLGYLLVPTLPPYRFLVYPGDLTGGPLFPWLNQILYDLEGLRQDCMPSGHTMITVLTLALAGKHSPRQLLWLGPIGFFLILATVALRYHWFIDVVVALPLAWAAWRLWPACYVPPVTRAGGPAPR